MNLSTVSIWGVVALFLALLSSPLFASSPEEDEILKHRVNQYLQALSVADLATAYRLERDAQGAHPKDPFQYTNEKRKARRMTKFMVDSIQRHEDSATAYIQSLVITPVGATSLQVPYYFKSQWVRLDQNWYHVADQPYTPDWLQAKIDAMAKEEAARNEEYARRFEAVQQAKAARQAEEAGGTTSGPVVPMPGTEPTAVSKP